MSKQAAEIKFAIEFPQGFILFMADDRAPEKVGGIYFQPHNSNDAFMVWGDRKELFGKSAITVSKDKDTDMGGYSVVYEFSGSRGLIDARLVKGDVTFQGELADENVFDVLQASVDQEITKFHGRDALTPKKVSNVARMMDGRLLIQFWDTRELYLGTPGNYKKLDAQLIAQGGCSMYYQLSTGGRIDLPYGYGGPNSETPTFCGEPMSYIKTNFGEDPVKFGLKIESGVTPLDPFSPGLDVNKLPPPKNQPRI